MRKLIPVAVIAGILILADIFIYQYQSKSELESQVRDLQAQLSHATIPLKPDTIRDSIPVVTQQVVTIDKTDYKQQAADRKLIKDLKMKVSQIEAENTMLRKTLGQVTLKPVNPDTVTSGVVTPERDSMFAYHDRWLDFLLDTRSGALNYAVRDSFKTFIDRVPRHRFLWMRWGVKGYYLKIVNFNPHSHVEYNQYLKVEK
ncbi:MAG: hypothetical protein J6W38_04810 [Prevotella sp.]|nr:hypothetical protein [Prevotella sp.]